MKKPQPPKEISLRIVRAIRMAGEEIPVGTVVTVDRAFAVELMSGGKAVETNAPPRAERIDTPRPQLKLGKSKHKGDSK